MDAVLDPELEDQYRNALKTVRRELRQSGHTIDGRAHARHQPRALIATIAIHFAADDWEDVNETLDPEGSFGQPSSEVIEVDGEVPDEEDPPALPPTKFRTVFVPRRHHLEEPLLRTKPERDLKDWFLDLSKYAHTNPLRTTTLVAEPVEEDDSDQALDQEPCHTFDAKIAEECSRCFEEALEAMQEKPKMSSLERFRFITEALAPEKPSPRPSTPKRHLHRLSLPLLESPTTPERSQVSRPYPFEDDPFSSPESLLAIDISEVQGRLHTLDSIESRQVSLPKPLLPHLSFQLPEHRQYPRFELESPLVLREESPQNPKLARERPCLGSLSEDPFVDPLGALGVLPPALVPSQSVTDSAMEECLQKNLSNASARVEGRLREELDPVDPSIRLKLPHVVPFDMIPEWMTCLGPREVRRHLRKAMGRAYKVKAGDEPDMRLRWNPLPVGYKGPEPERISKQSARTPPPVALKEQSTSRNLLQEQGVPKILAQDYADDILPSISHDSSAPVMAVSPYFSSRAKNTVSLEASPPMRPPPTKDDLAVLIRKRRADSQLINSNPAHRLSISKPPNPLTPPRQALLMDGEDQNPARRLLQNLMRMRAPEKVPAEPKAALPTPLYSAKQDAIVSKETDLEPMTSHIPDFEVPATPHRVVVSTSLSWAFVSFLRGWLPGIVLIDRDLSTSDSQTQSAEADIIPSPTVGIILTTMLKVRQAPVPGSGGLSQLRERIMRVALLYERLAVLVSEDNPTSESANVMSESDISAYRDFISFSLAISSAQVRVTHVGGGPKTHASWAAFTICRFAASDRIRNCLSFDEKPFELSLRSMGMNAYASQVLVSHLEGTHGEGAFQHFLTTSLEEKLQISREIFGADHVMRRVAAGLSK